MYYLIFLYFNGPPKVYLGLNFVNFYIYTLSSLNFLLLLSVFPVVLTLNTLVRMVIMFLFLILVTHVSEAYNTCPKCGSIDVPYPLSTDDNCGDPRYKVYCNNGILEFLSARGFYYKNLSINPSAYELIISPPPIQKDTCYSSDLSSGGLKLDENLPFNISTHNTVCCLIALNTLFGRL